MKRGFKWFLVVLIAIFLGVIAQSEKISATNKPLEFWSDVGDFTRIDENGGTYTPEEEFKNKINFEFDYEWKIQTTRGILDQGLVVSEFYGAHKSIDVTYKNLTGIAIINPIADIFTVEKYDFTEEAFSKITDYKKDASGTHTLSEAGIYKLYTKINSDTVEKYIYVVVENFDSLAGYEFTSVGMIEADTPTFQMVVNITDVREIKATNVYFYVTFTDNNNTNNGIILDQTSKIENNVLTITFTKNFEREYKIKRIKITIKDDDSNNYGDVIYEVEDTNNPIILDFTYPANTEIKYYNKELINNDFSINSLENIRPSHNMVSKFSVSDTSEIKSITVNDKECEAIYNEDTKQHDVTCSFAELQLTSSTITYKIIDEYNNISTIVVDTKTGHDDSVLNMDEFVENLEITNDYVKINTNLIDFYKVCVFYGEDFDSLYTCYGTKKITPTYYFNNKGIVLIMDESLNIQYNVFDMQFGNQTITDPVELDGGYNVINFKDYYDSIAYEVHRSLITDSYLEIDGREIVIGNSNYILLLNSIVKDTSCAFNKCNKTVNIVVKYNLGNKEQVVVKPLNITDKLPTITSNYAATIYKDNLVLEYKNFTIDSEIKEKLNITANDEYQVLLEDELGNSYEGELTRRLVSYTDKNGNVTTYTTEDYDYIATKGEMGVYLLEYKVTYKDNNKIPFDGKNFYISVEIKDTTKPTLTLKGDAKLTINQYDVYTDAGATCNDLDTCVLETKYYFNGEEIGEVATNKAGKLTIKYIATDSSGNVATLERTVNIKGQNSIDTKTIIIIGVIILIFIIFILLNVYSQNKKKKKMMSGESN